MAYSFVPARNGRAAIHVLGGAHVSKTSAEAAIEIIQRVKPGVVLLELCEERAFMLDGNRDILPSLGDIAWKNPLTLLSPLFWFVI